MRQRLSVSLVLLLIIVIGGIAYFFGKKSARGTIDNMVMNNVLIQQIAELSSLEVQGNTSIKSTNIANDGSITDNFRKLFMERTLNISMPYVAKYGVDLNKQTVRIEEKNKQVYVVLPNPRLLSYELRLDKANTMSRRGLFEVSDDETYNRIMKKLYAQSKAGLEQNKAYQEKSKEKIIKIIRDYYAPLHHKVSVVFDDEVRNKVVGEERQ